MDEPDIILTIGDTEEFYFDLDDQDGDVALTGKTVKGWFFSPGGSTQIVELDGELVAPSNLQAKFTLTNEQSKSFSSATYSFEVKVYAADLSYLKTFRFSARFDKSYKTL